MQDRLIKEVFGMLRQRQLMLATAESCTGGLVAACMTSLAGSSAVFERGWVTYTNQAKETELGVNRAIFDGSGAVSEACVLAMARGAIQYSNADVSLAVSGIAGPGGAVPDKPVGTVWLAWGLGQGRFEAQVFHFAGDRQQVREQAVEQALTGLLRRL